LLYLHQSYLTGKHCITWMIFKLVNKLFKIIGCQLADVLFFILIPFRYPVFIFCYMILTGLKEKAKKSSPLLQIIYIVRSITFGCFWTAVSTITSMLCWCRLKFWLTTFYPSQICVSDLMKLFDTLTC